jgi:hypothetical protein
VAQLEIGHTLHRKSLNRLGGMTNPAGRGLIIVAMRQVSAARVSTFNRGGQSPGPLEWPQQKTGTA